VHDGTAEPGDDYLFVRLRGAVAAVEAAVASMGDDARALGARVLRMDPREAAQDWRASGEQTLPFFDPPAEDLCLWRLSVPQTAAVIDLPGASAGAQYIEWQGAQRWLWAPASAAAALRQAAQAAGGHATLFRASRLGGDKQAGTSSPMEAVQQRIARELQKQFDPQGVFATGRLGF
jgi:glycolate oxidase FAD binding subunit